MSGETLQLERELIEKAQTNLHEKIELGEFNGDVQENMLLVLLSINRRVGRICSNPMIILGDFWKEHPKTSITIGMVVWVLLGAGSLVGITAFLNAVGASIHLAP